MRTTMNIDDESSLGSGGFIDRLESMSGRTLRPARPQAQGWIAESDAATTDCEPPFSIPSPESNESLARVIAMDGIYAGFAGAETGHRGAALGGGSWPHRGIACRAGPA